MSLLKSNQILGILLIIQSLLIFVPMYILGTAIDWPASLDLPSNQILPLIHLKAVVFHQNKIVHPLSIGVLRTVF